MVVLDVVGWATRFLNILMFQRKAKKAILKVKSFRVVKANQGPNKVMLLTTIDFMLRMLCKR